MTCFLQTPNIAFWTEKSMPFPIWRKKTTTMAKHWTAIESKPKQNCCLEVYVSPWLWKTSQVPKGLDFPTHNQPMWYQGWWGIGTTQRLGPLFLPSPSVPLPLPCLLSLLSPSFLFSPSSCSTVAVFWSLLFSFSFCWASANQQLCYLTILFYTLSPFEMAYFLPLFLLLTGLVFLAFKP